MKFQALALAVALVGGLSAQSAGSFTESGLAVYYGGKADARTSFTAAHRTLAFGTWVRVSRTDTARSVTVLVNDRGPWDDSRRIIDLSIAAARQLGILNAGIAPVTIVAVATPR